MSDPLLMLNGFYCLRLSDGNSTKVWRVNNRGMPGGTGFCYKRVFHSSAFIRCDFGNWFDKRPN